jgi:hypothetical protein
MFRFILITVIFFPYFYGFFLSIVMFCIFFICIYGRRFGIVLQIKFLFLVPFTVSIYHIDLVIKMSVDYF